MAVNLFLLYVAAVTVASAVENLKLEQVLILSRHNVRAPLTKNLQRVTAFEWPPWDVPAGHLTEKGGRLEKNMGEYFSLWFKNKGLFTDECPDSDSVYIYCNNVHRTIKSAEAFSGAAFKNCNISVHYNKNLKVEDFNRDPVFAPLIKNNTVSFEESYYRYLKEKLNNLHLEEAYEVLNNIIDVTNSDICKQESFCDFNMKKDEIVFMIGDEPNIDGPLAISNFIVDSILMSYYNGKPEEKIAWGRIKTEEEWRSLLDITRENQNVRFNQPQLSKIIARPMLNYIRDTFLKNARKFTALVGHDSNQSGLMAAFGFKKFNLTGQYERTPVGGKIVFQKWRDENSNYLLKIEYIYESMEQLRSESVLSWDNPPHSQIMELEKCKTDDFGYCPWDDFVKLLEKLC